MNPHLLLQIVCLTISSLCAIFVYRIRAVAGRKALGIIFFLLGLNVVAFLVVLLKTIDVTQ